MSKPRNPAAPMPSPLVAVADVSAGERRTTLAKEREDGHADASLAVSQDAESTASISSSILEYRTIHGRTYHSHRGNALYWGANDEKQNEAMNINHHILTLVTDGKHFLAPLNEKKIRTVLDVGTGTGIWAIDFADAFPHARVIGIDISPIQPSWTPPNVEFQIDDCTQEWIFEPDSMDYVHVRWLLGSIVDWFALFREAFKTTRPGGYLESIEPSPYLESDDGSVTDGSTADQWGKIFVEAGKVLGRPFTIFQEDLQQRAMEAAGFVDIDVLDEKIPLGDWPLNPRQKDMGRFSQYALEKDIEGTVQFAAKQIGRNPEETQAYCDLFRQDLECNKFHAFYRMRTVVGRKPYSV